MNTAQLFNDSYERIVMRRYARFFQDFYQRFITSSSVIAKAFENTDEVRRYLMLEESLLILMDYAIHGEAGDDLRQLAVVHRRLHLAAEAFELWLSALIETLQDLDPEFDEQYVKAWRDTLQPGITFMLNYDENT